MSNTTLDVPEQPEPAPARPTGPGAKASRSLLDPTIMKAAAVDSFRKLAPRLMVRNPVMFVVWVGSIVTTIFFVRDVFDGDTSGAENLFAGLVAAWLWFTVLFANFAEAVAEGRGKAQADTLRKARSETVANRRRPDGSLEPVPSSQLDVDDVVVVTAGEMIPSDGEIIEGIASVDESAITGESAPVIRESGGDRSAVTGGTRVLSDQIVVRITARPGRDVPRPHDLAGRGRQPAEDAQRDRPQHPAGRPHHHLPAGHGHAAALRHLLGGRADGDHADRPARVPDPDDDRRPAVGHRHRRHGPAGAAQRAGHVRPGRRGGGRLLDAAARQDRHDHARQPPGRRVPAAGRRRRRAAGRRGPARQPGRRDARGPVDRRAGQGALRRARARGRARHAGAVHRPDPHERARRRRDVGAEGCGRVGAPVGGRAGRQGARRPRRPRRGCGHRGRHAAGRRRGSHRRHWRRRCGRRGWWRWGRHRRRRRCRGARRRPPQGRRQAGHARSASTSSAPWASAR